MTTASATNDRDRKATEFERSLHLMPYEVLRSECERLHTTHHGERHLQTYLSLGGYADVTDCIGELAYQYANGVTVFDETL